MSKISSFKSIEIKHDIYRSKDCIKKFDESVREHAMKIINFKKKKKRSYQQKRSRNQEKKNAKICYICQNKIEKEYVKKKKIRKVEDR